MSIAWVLIAAYAIVAIVLAVRGYRRTRSIESYAVGGKAGFSPLFVGLSLAAQLTSVATFVVNPGLVYAYGLAGLLGMGVAASLGVFVGVVVLSRGFRRVGQQVSALTVPGWLGKRYDSRALQLGFAVLSLALVAFVVLILVAMAHVLTTLLGVPAWAALVGVIVFVFGTVLFGGVSSSIYTNSVQALVMLAVALMLIGSGFSFVSDGFAALSARLAAIDVNLTGVVNPTSPYFRNLFEVFVCNALVGFALVCQPHVLTKSLMLKRERDMRRYLVTAIAVGVAFAGVMIVGLYARLSVPAGTPIDRAMPTYIAQTFSPAMGAIVGVGVLCAGISTLEGLLLALSAILATDLFAPLLAWRARRAELATAKRQGDGTAPLRWARISVVVIGAVSFALSLVQMENPTGGSVAIFAQYGIYALFSASFVPMLLGMSRLPATSRVVGASALTAVLTYVGASLAGVLPLSNNPAVLSTYAIVASGVVAAAGVAWRGLAAARTGGAANGASAGV